MLYALTTTAASLEKLPNEILYEIAQYFGDETYLPRKYRTAYSLSLVNHRLRYFALPLLYQDIYVDARTRWLSDKTIPVSTAAKFLHILEYFRSEGKDKAGFVRSIRIGDMDRFGEDDLYPIDDRVLPFPNLTSFECLSLICQEDVLASLVGSPRLKKLVLAWRDRAPFPDIAPFKELRTLRIILQINPGQAFEHPKMPPASFPSLTTLVVHDSDGSCWFDGYCHDLTFPNLRVFNLQDSTSRPRCIYNFIQRHPTLMEVNVMFCEDIPALRLEGLIKLIDGTGTWGCGGSDGPSRNPKDGNKGLDQPCVDKHGELYPFPDDIPNTHISFDAFAFSRVPLSDNALESRSSSRSKQPRYTATALAFRVLDQCIWEDFGYGIAYIPDFFLLVDKFPILEELRIASDTLHDEGNFTTFMEKLANRLRNWKRLRKLTISWTIPEDWRWGNPDPVLHTIANSRHTTLFDDVIPPIEALRAGLDDNEDPRPLSVQDLGELYTPEFAHSVEERVRELLGEEVELDVLDKGLCMRVWQMRNEVRVAKMMRLLATHCPTLEDIDWYPVGPFSLDDTTLWKWKVFREKDDSTKVRMVSGDLTWIGCHRGDPPQIEMLVGQELAYSRAQRKKDGNFW